MTVIAWDGKTVAADRRSTESGTIRTVTKLYVHEGAVLAYSGTAIAGQAMVKWYRGGCVPSEFPEIQKDKEDWCRFVVFRHGAQPMCYERALEPLVFEDPWFACGSGRDYATAALYLGKTATEAVSVACQFDSNCGNGIQSIDLEGL